MHEQTVISPTRRVRAAARRWSDVFHRWLGFTVGAILVITGLTGTLLAFYVEIERGLYPHMQTVHPRALPSSYEAVYQRLAQLPPIDPPGGTWSIEIPRDGGVITSRRYYIAFSSAVRPARMVEERQLRLHWKNMSLEARWPAIGPGSHRYTFLQLFYDVLQIVLCRRSAQTESNRPQPQFRLNTHRHQHRRHRRCSCVTRRSGGRSDFVQIGKQLVTLLISKADVERVRQALRRMTVQDHGVAKLPLQAVPEVCGQAPESIATRVEACKAAGGAESCDEQHVLGAGAAAVLVSGTVHERFYRRVVSHVQSANPFRGVQLMPGHAEQVDAKPLHVDVDLSDRLRRINVKEQTGLPRDARNVGDWFDRPDFVVRVHDADENRLAFQRPPHIVWIDDPGRVDRQSRNGGAQPFQEAARFEHCWVFDLRRDDVGAVNPPPEAHTLDGVIVRFGAAAGEHDLMRRCIEQRGNLVARLIDDTA